jgi:hypothetical protein
LALFRAEGLFCQQEETSGNFWWVPSLSTYGYNNSTALVHFPSNHQPPTLLIMVKETYVLSVSAISTMLISSLPENITISSKYNLMHQKATSKRRTGKSKPDFLGYCCSVDSALYRALRLHPDKGGDPELFKEVTHA